MITLRIDRYTAGLRWGEPIVPMAGIGLLVPVLVRFDPPLRRALIVWSITTSFYVITWLWRTLAARVAKIEADQVSLTEVSRLGIRRTIDSTSISVIGCRPTEQPGLFIGPYIALDASGKAVMFFKERNWSHQQMRELARVVGASFDPARYVPDEPSHHFWVAMVGLISFAVVASVPFIDRIALPWRIGLPAVCGVTLLASYRYLRARRWDYTWRPRPSDG